MMLLFLDLQERAHGVAVNSWYDASSSYLLPMARPASSRRPIGRAPRLSPPPLPSKDDWVPFCA
jgi:hypothetical protein